MSWVAVHNGDVEVVFALQPTRQNKLKMWWISEREGFDFGTPLPNGSIKKLIGKDLTWEDEPVELKEEYIMCKYCKGSIEFEIENKPEDTSLSIEDATLVMRYESYSRYYDIERHDIKINFCPFCGRKLK